MKPVIPTKITEHRADQRNNPSTIFYFLELSDVTAMSNKNSPAAFYREIVKATLHEIVTVSYFFRWFQVINIVSYRKIDYTRPC